MKPLNSNRIYTVFLILFFASQFCFSQEQIVYKQIDTTKLLMKIYQPQKSLTKQKYPAMLFFFGGGWKTGSLNQFEPHAKYFSKRGMVCILVDYRVEDRHKSTIFESLKDAKSAMRYVKEHANVHNIDTLKIVAAGGSAGGQLAATTALIEEYNEISENLAISCKPNALVLFNPAIDNGPGGVGYERVKAAYKNISPIHNITKGAPPTIIMLGTKDNLIPVETAKYYQLVMNKVGSRCELILYEGKEHGFFNYNKFENYKKTISDVDAFLQSEGFLTNDQMVDID